MNRNEAFKDVVADVCKLLNQSARGKQRTILLSPEVAEALERVHQVEPEPGWSGDDPVAGPAAAEKPTMPANDIDVRDIPDLPGLEKVVSVCVKCSLAETRTQTVFGSGNPNAKLVFVGEAPGVEEDRQGKPFVGRAGQLLTDIIEKGMKLPRSEVYICNVLKCHPPINRNPLPQEVEMCEPYLIRQLEIIKPKVICALGAYAAQTLLKTTEPIGKLRGTWHFYHGIPLRATYHPAYLLRSPGDKRKTWMDVLEVMKVYNGEFTPEPKP